VSGLPDLKLPNLDRPGPRPEAWRGIYPSGPSTDVGEYTAEENEFIRAIAHFRTVNKIGCPTLCQLLWVLKQLGYRRGDSAALRSCR
jgi:hypothetical protein